MVKIDKNYIDELSLSEPITFDNRIKVIETDIRKEIEENGTFSKDVYIQKLIDIRKICSTTMEEYEKRGVSDPTYNKYAGEFKSVQDRLDKVMQLSDNCVYGEIEKSEEEITKVNVEAKPKPAKKTTSKKKVEFEESVNSVDEAENIAKASKPLEVKNVVPKDEPTIEEIRTESPKNKIVETEELKPAIKIEKDEVEDAEIVPKKITKIPAPKFEEEPVVVEEPVPEIETKEDIKVPSKNQVEEAEPELEIESNAKKIIVVNGNKKNSESEEDNKEPEEEEYYDANGYRSEGPLVNDDNTLLSNEELQNVEIVDVKEAKKLENEETNKDNDYSESKIDEDKVLYESSKAISRKRINPMLNTLQHLDTSKYDVSKISVFDFNGEDEEFRKEYITSRNNMMAAPRVSRIALLMSGHYEEISAYGNWDFGSIGRKLSDESLDFVDREVFLYNSIYSHVMYVSYSKSVPDFETWAKHIYYPDLNTLFFGVYDANSVGVNNYVAECPKCGKEIVIPRENKDLAVAVSNVFDKNALDKFITYKDIMKQDFSPMYKWASETSVRQQLNNTKYIVDYGVPTLYDYLTTIATLKRISARDNVDIDISNIETFADPDTALRIYHYMYIKRLGVPSVVKGTNKIKFIGLTSKADIIEFLNALDVNDYSQLVNAPEISDFITKSACDFYIEDAKCNDEECGHVIKHLLFNPKRAFFFKIGEVRASLS